MCARAQISPYIYIYILLYGGKRAHIDHIVYMGRRFSAVRFARVTRFERFGSGGSPGSGGSVRAVPPVRPVRAVRAVPVRAFPEFPAVPGGQWFRFARFLWCVRFLAVRFQEVWFRRFGSVSRPS